MNTLNVLIVEDNRDIAENIGDYLEINGHAVDFAFNGQMAVELCNSNKYDIILMDVMMPKLNGLEATKLLRQGDNFDVPIIMLTAKDKVNERIAGLEAGADDYLVKPFAMEELNARIFAQLRKSQKTYKKEMTFVGVKLNDNDESVSASNHTVQLKPMPYKIFKKLLTEYPNIVDKPSLLHFLWHDDLPDKDLLRSHIYNLRQALEQFGGYVQVQSKHGKGYKLVIENE